MRDGLKVDLGINRWVQVGDYKVTVLDISNDGVDVGLGNMLASYHIISVFMTEGGHYTLPNGATITYKSFNERYKTVKFAVKGDPNIVIDRDVIALRKMLTQGINKELIENEIIRSGISRRKVYEK